MDLLNDEFLAFFDCAQKNQLNYMLIGGFAVNYYGYNRTTNDLDIWLEPSNENKEKFIQVLLCIGYTENEIEDIKEEDFTMHFKCTIGTTPFTIDALTYVHHQLDYFKAKENCQIIEISNGIEANIVPFDYLREMKIRASRNKDLLDVSELDKIRNLKK